ncbi:hypothetical protein [Thiofilum flexile]|uniref:hypothetical protein n=1 Tax=Thiofilum flexile TaxID=125627 RepID=UPI0013A53408|nr:hypothetical protein [Thiofilum flexile]
MEQDQETSEPSVLQKILKAVLVLLDAATIKTIESERIHLDGCAVIEIEPPTVRELINKKIISSDSLAVWHTDIIEVDEDDDLWEKKKHLNGKFGGFTIHIRQSHTNTWFLIQIKSPEAMELETIDMMGFEEEEDEDEWYEDEGGPLTQEDINTIAVATATRPEFASLRNRKERRTFVEVNSKELGFDHSGVPYDYQLSGVTDLAESYYELKVLPEQCKALEKEGDTPKIIAKKIGKSVAKVEKALKTNTPAFIGDIDKSISG